MNLHGYLVRKNILYTSNEAIEFCDVFFAMIRYYSIKSSLKISAERNKAFEGFEKSEYAKGKESKVLSKYYNNSYLPKSEKVKSLFKGIYIPTKNDWANLYIDQGISTTLFVTDDKTTRDIARYYIYAYKKGVKSLYHTRTKLTREDNECLLCSV